MTDTFSAVPQVLVDDEPLEDAVANLVASVEVDARLGLPTMVAVTLRDPGLSVLEDARLRIGSALEVRAGPVGTGARASLAAVEVTGIEASYATQARQVVVRGYDASHRLHRGRRTRSYHDVTDGDVLRTVAEQAGLQTGRVDDPGIVHPHLAQVESSDWDFLDSRAWEADRVLGVRDGRLELVQREHAAEAPEPGVLASEEPRQLVLGREVESFRGRLSAAEVPHEVQVRAWSAELKRAMTALAPTTASGTALPSTPDELASRFGSSTLTCADRSLGSPEEVEATAAALAEAAGSGFATASLVCRGDPLLVAGGTVSVGLAGGTFSGRWTVTAVRHLLDGSGFRTALQLGGTGDRELLGSLCAAGRDAGAPRHGGVVPAVVTDISDDDDRARVRVSLPLLSGDYVSDWVRVLIPGAGGQRGMLVLPEVDDEVLVAFEQGDVRRPYVLGGLHNGKDLPPLDGGGVDASSGTSGRRGLVSRLGHRVELDDSEGSPRIVVSTASGDVEVVLDERSADLVVTARSRVDVTADTVTVAARSVELRGDAEVSVAAPNISIEADAELRLRGGVVRIN